MPLTDYQHELAQAVAREMRGWLPKDRAEFLREITGENNDAARLDFLIHAAANSRTGISLERCRNGQEAKWRVAWWHHMPAPEQYDPRTAIDDAMAAWTTSASGMVERHNASR